MRSGLHFYLQISRITMNIRWGVVENRPKVYPVFPLDTHSALSYT